ncbi:hypothetical protein EV426DRAFT_722150 [Tirmania nivea]|nr:hypothetical protein EV426DRAFT_722150 [Tirmania nivea]
MLPPYAQNLVGILPTAFSTSALAFAKMELAGEDKFPDGPKTFFIPPNSAWKRLGYRINAFLFSSFGEKYLAALFEPAVWYQGTKLWIKIPPQKTPPHDKLVKAVVIHGVPCQRPIADIIQDMGVRGIMGARWLFGGNWRLGKATSSVVVFFDRKLAVGSHLKMRGRWLPMEAYDFNRGK